MRYLIESIEGNRQHLDGGAMFGNVPRAMWERWIAPDEQHRIELACRSFLIHDQQRERRILLEAGIGLFFPPKLRERFGVREPDHRLLTNLAARGVQPEQIDVIVLSHLHFDHIGGLLTPWRPDGGYALAFPRARFVVSERAWQRALAPHLRDRASFVPEALELLGDAQRAERLELITSEGPSSAMLGPDFSCSFSEGHTPGLLLTELATERGSLLFCGDLIPARPWVHLPVTMGYDRYPELLIDEKERVLTRCLESGTRLLLTHDADCAACGVARDATGRFAPTDTLAELRGFEL